MGIANRNLAGAEKPARLGQTNPDNPCRSLSGCLKTRVQTMGVAHRYAVAAFQAAC